MIPLLQRRVFLNLLQAFLICLAILLFFMFMWRGIQSGGILAGIELNIWSTLRLYAYLLPALTLEILPLATAFALYLAVSRMNAERELLALRASGLSLYSLLPASVLFGLLAAALALVLSLYGQSWGLTAMRGQMLNLAESSVRLVLRPGVFNQDLPGMVFFARRIDQDSGQISGITIVDSSQTGNPTVISAPTGFLGTDYQRGEIYLLLQNGTADLSNQETMTRLAFDEYVLRFALQSLLSGQSLGPVSAREMSLRDLWSSHDPSLADQEQLQIRVELSKRLVYPLSCLVLALGLLPVACTSHGIRQRTSPLNAMLALAVYYGPLLLVEDLSLKGNTALLSGFWLLPLIFTCLALLNLYLTNAERKPALFDGTLLEGLFRRKASAQTPQQD